ncbi:hypothetical protein [Mycolicibacterium celeriflavum]|uniref:hypothetical protein n=1 Tax=Mycolicibacterium celeriflavum TaxID=1249101 RepID=UPI003CF9B265
MGEVLIGSEAVAARRISRGALRWNYRTIYPDVYLPRDVELTMPIKAKAAYLWTRRRGVITGRAAAALHGAMWVNASDPVELIWTNNHRPAGIITRRERISPDEVVMADGIPTATPGRTAFDLGRHLPRTQAVIHLDALVRATGLTAEDVSLMAERYGSARGVRRLREAIEVMDGGAQSPKESWLRLLLVDAGYPKPQTQIPVFDDWGIEFAFLDMGWRELMIAVEYDGDQHRKDRARYVWDERRLRRLTRAGWLHVKVIAEDRRSDILARVEAAWQFRQREGMAVNLPA